MPRRPIKTALGPALLAVLAVLPAPPAAGSCQTWFCGQQFDFRERQSESELRDSLLRRPLTDSAAYRRDVERLRRG